MNPEKERQLWRILSFLFSIGVPMDGRVHDWYTAAERTRREQELLAQTRELAGKLITDHTRQKAREFMEALDPTLQIFLKWR